MFNVGDTLLKLATESGFAGFFANGGWQNLVMIVIACVLLYLGIVKGFEPLLLVGIAFGCLLANVSYFPGLDAVNPEPVSYTHLTYADAAEWDVKAKDLASRFIKNFAKYEGNEAGKALVAAGPQL